MVTALINPDAVKTGAGAAKKDKHSEENVWPRATIKGTATNPIMAWIATLRAAWGCTTGKRDPSFKKSGVAAIHGVNPTMTKANTRRGATVPRSTRTVGGVHANATSSHAPMTIDVTCIREKYVTPASITGSLDEFSWAWNCPTRLQKSACRDTARLREPPCFPVGARSSTSWCARAECRPTRILPTCRDQGGVQA